jgi:fructokinase
MVTAARELRETHALDLLVVTRGSAGAILVNQDEAVHGRPAEVEDLVDTVGAGDAFSAVMILGLLQGWPLSTTLARALEFAAAVCGMRGATSLDHGLYADHLARWQTAGGDTDSE